MTVVRRHFWQIALGGLLASLWLFQLVRPMGTNLDSAYMLIWGKEMITGHLPDYDVYVSPTPHPIFQLYTGLLAPLGPRLAETAMIWLSGVMYVGFIAAVFSIVRRLFNTPVAVAAVAVILTRTDTLFYAVRGMHDMPFLTLIFGAAAFELRRPGRGVGPMSMLAVAGLIRPEGWLLAAIYWLWLVFTRARAAGGVPVRQIKWLTGLAVLGAAPAVLWIALDWLATGDPFWSSHSTRVWAEVLARQRSLPEALWLLPRYLGGSERWVNVLAGTTGLVFAAIYLRKRVAILAGLAAVGTFAYVLTAASGLSVIPRYMLVPSVIFNIGVGVSLLGWTLLPPGHRRRRLAVGLAVVTVIGIAVRVPKYQADVNKFDTTSRVISEAHSDLLAVIRRPAVGRAIRSCRPTILPTYDDVPLVRYNLGFSKHQVLAASEFERPPERGVLLLPSSALRPPLLIPRDKHVERKLWANTPLPGFQPITEVGGWIAYSSCTGGGEK